LFFGEFVSSGFHEGADGLALSNDADFLAERFLRNGFPGNYKRFL